MFSFFLIGVSGTDAAEMGRPHSTGIELRGASQGRTLRGVLTMYIWKMTEAVGLTEEQAAQVFPKIREVFQIRWQSAARRQGLLRSLERELDSLSGEEDQLKGLLAQLEANEAGRYSAQQEMRQVLMRVLTSEQQARSLLFEEQFQGDLSQVIRETKRVRLQRSSQQQRDEGP